MSTSVFEVTGMHCGSCAGKVSEAIMTLDGVTEVDIDLAAGRLSVTSEKPVDDVTVIDAVVGAGYQGARV